MKKKSPLRLISYYGAAVQYSFKWKNMTGAGAEAGVRAGAEVMDKGGAEKEPEPKINDFGSATLDCAVLIQYLYSD